MVHIEKPSIGHALDLYAKKNQKEAQLVGSAIRIPYPPAKTMAMIELKMFLNQESLEDLGTKITPEGNRWVPELEQALKDEGLSGDTYFKSYPRAIKRFIEFADSIGLVTKICDCILPEWNELLGKLQGRVPGSMKELGLLRKAGVRELAGYDIGAGTLSQVTKKMQSVRTNFKRVAKVASRQGLTPRELIQLVLDGSNPYQLTGFNNRNIGYYFFQNGWNYLAEAFPESALPQWPDRSKRVSIPFGELPLAIQCGLEDSLLYEGRDIKDSTRSLTKNTATAYMGILEAEGICLSNLASGLAPKDAVRLLYQGFPRNKLTGNPDMDTPIALCQRLQNDTKYRDEVLAEMRALEGSHDGLESCETPFISVVMDHRYAEGQYPAARNLIKDAKTINQNYLSMRGRHLEWISNRKKEIDRKGKAQETPYDAKKVVAFKHPELWLALIQEAQRLSQAIISDSHRGSRQWATNVRNILFLNMILVYPLRINHFIRMKLGEHFDPISYQMTFNANNTKNDRIIDYELPDKGGLGQIRNLVDIYIKEARPILLYGRISPYFLVPSQQTPNAGIHVREKGFNDILIQVSKRYLADIIPAAMGHLNPHLIRHIVASFQLVIKNDLTRAAQLLNDRPETVLKYYSDVLKSARTSLKSFYNDIFPDNTAA